ncbi:MAG: SAM-dependent methyltransferase [Acidobacteriota bacterium]
MSDRITFRDFMYSALYDEKRGYYMTDRSHFGPSGDFNTTGQFHELFGQIMASEFEQLFRSLGSPLHFTIVELGPGNGDFALQVLTEMRSSYPEALSRTRYFCCEVSPVLERQQRKRLGEFSCVRWISGLDKIDQPLRGVFFSNEFFDALPVHIIRGSRGRLLEVFVARSSSGELFFEEDEISHPLLWDFWHRVGVPLREGHLAEINLDAVDTLRRVAEKLECGQVITIDYGELAEFLYTAARPEGTLRCFSRHRLGDAPLDRIGEQDLTASVNFDALIDYGSEFDLELVSFGSQTDYLLERGLLDRVARIGEGAEVETSKSLERRLALKQLFVPGGIAAHFKVLVQRKE